MSDDDISAEALEDFSELLRPRGVTLEDLQGALREVYEQRHEAPVMVLHPATYDAVQWELRRTKIVVDYEIVPGVLRARRLIARARQFRRRLGWWMEERPRW